MDINGMSFNLFTNHSSRGSDIVNVEKMTANEYEYDRSVLFVNYAEIAWQELRRAWRGDQSIASQIKPREPMRHCCCVAQVPLRRNYVHPLNLLMDQFLYLRWSSFWLKCGKTICKTKTRQSNSYIATSVPNLQEQQLHEQVTLNYLKLDYYLKLDCTLGAFVLTSAILASRSTKESIIDLNLRYWSPRCGTSKTGGIKINGD